MSELSIITVFFAGLATFFAPCTFTALPTFLTYLSNKVGDDKDTEKGLDLRIIWGTFLYLIGFLSVFTAAGLTATALGSFFNHNKDLFTRIGGGLIALFGLITLFGDRISALRFLYKEQKVHIDLKKAKSSALFPLILGITNAFAWTPCIGPILGGVLLLTGNASSTGAGGVLLFAYGLGVSIPFLLLAIFFSYSKQFVAKTRKFAQIVYTLSAILMILLGISFIFGYADIVFAFLYRIFLQLGYKPV